MKITETSLPGVLIVDPVVYSDVRGTFWESWNSKVFEAAGLPTVWVQDNCSYSSKNVVRGIHYQIVQPQAKLVRVTHGAVWDVAVDLRRSSPNYGRHVGLELNAENGRMLYIPVGFGHAFAVLSEDAGFAYKVTDHYCPAGERTIVWNDPDLRIDWPLNEKAAIVSAKDLNGASFREAEVFP